MPLLLTTVAAAQPNADGTDRVTLRLPDAPLALVAHRLTTQEQLLTIGPEFAESKASLFVDQRPREDVLAAIAETFGATWRALAPGHWELRQDAQVLDWKRRWGRARVEAETAARSFQARVARAYLDKIIESTRTLPDDPQTQLPIGVANLRLSSFLDTLSSMQLDALADAVGASTELQDGDEPQTTFSRVVLPHRQCSKEQQAIIRGWLAEAIHSHAPDKPRIDRRLDRAVVRFSAGRSINLVLQFEDGAEASENVAALRASPRKVQQVYRDVILWRMAHTPTPKGALLGSALRRQNVVDQLSGQMRPSYSVEPALGGDANDLARMLVRIPSEKRLLSDLLEQVHRLTRCAIVSDSFFAPPATFGTGANQPLSDVLSRICSSHSYVIKSKSGTLLLRSAVWPELEGMEPPAPELPVLLEKKKSGSAISFGELLSMTGWRRAQLSSLATSKVEGADFTREVGFIRRNRDLLQELAKLPDVEARLRKTGLRLNAFQGRSRERIGVWLKNQCEDKSVSGNEIQMGELRLVARQRGVRQEHSALEFGLPGKGLYWFQNLPR